MGPNFLDEIDCGSFFDHIDDLIEFPPDNECGNGLIGSGDCKNFPSIWDEPLPDTDPLFHASITNSGSDLSAELSVPYEDIVQLEWLSTFVEDSFSGGGMTLGKDNSSVKKDNPCTHFQTSSPVSVLESSSSSSSSSCSVGKAIPLSPNHRGPQRARSKRPRPATFNPRPAIQLISQTSTFNPRPAVQLISPTSSFTETPQPFLAPGVSSESENFAESECVKKFPKPVAGEQKKKKKIKLTVPLGPTEINQNPPSQAVRKCMHCEITKTPQWRAGPMGPKTLCNACGVRYKSGRLFPEYRPAASPTFVPAVHSNSHKKVLEMRGKVVEKSTPVGTAAKTSTASHRELVPDSNPSVEYI